jgi:AraC-like DNA-binding protein
VDARAWQVHTGEVVTHPCVHLTVQRSTGDPDIATVTGVQTRRFEQPLVGTGRVVGAQFTPAGFAAFTDRAMSTLADRRVPAGDLLGAGTHADLLALADVAEVDVAAALTRLEGLLVAREPRLHPHAGVVDEAVAFIVSDRSTTRVEQVAERLGVTTRTLQRRFERYLGVGPKWVIQRRRIHDALDEIENGGDPDWSDLAVRLGFADQAHFTNAFTEMVGHPPSRYARRPAAH